MKDVRLKPQVIELTTFGLTGVKVIYEIIFVCFSQEFIFLFEGTFEGTVTFETLH